MIRENRNVDLATRFELLKRKPFNLIFGLAFSIFPVFVALMIGYIFALVDEDLPEVDYEEVFANGTQTTGKLIDIETQYNVSINNQHPTILTFSYDVEGVEKSSKVKVLSPSKVNNLKIGDYMEVKHLGDQSILLGYPSYSFPFYFIYLIPIPFLLIGLGTVWAGLSSAFREIKLSKHGESKKGEILSMTPTIGKGLRQSIEVIYQYDHPNGNKVIGKSRTYDYSILSEKAKGDPIRILVSPDNPSKSCLYPEIVAVKNNWRDL